MLDMQWLACMRLALRSTQSIAPIRRHTSKPQRPSCLRRTRTSHARQGLLLSLVSRAATGLRAAIPNLPLRLLSTLDLHTLRQVQTRSTIGGERARPLGASFRQKRTPSKVSAAGCVGCLPVLTSSRGRGKSRRGGARGGRPCACGTGPCSRWHARFLTNCETLSRPRYFCCGSRPCCFIGGNCAQSPSHQAHLSHTRPTPPKRRRRCWRLASYRSTPRPVCAR